MQRRVPPLRVLIAAPLVILAPGLASAAAVALVFTGTSGSGTPGGATIQAQPGDVLTLEVRVSSAPEGVA